MILHPNKTFVAEFTTDYAYLLRHFIIITASSEEVAIEHLYDKFRIRPKLTWLMNCDHTYIYDQNGDIAIKQAKILYHSNQKA